jgi:hypothetical protein
VHANAVGTTRRNRHHARTGNWPRRESGSIPEAPGDSWCAVDAALRAGLRHLPGGCTLYRFLKKHGRTGRE